MGHSAESKTHISLSLSDFTDAPPALGWTALPKARARGITESLQAAGWERRETVSIVEKKSKVLHSHTNLILCLGKIQLIERSLNICISTGEQMLKD